MAKVPKSKSARPRKGSHRAAGRGESRSSSRGESRHGDNVRPIRALREHEVDDEPTRYRVVSQHGPIFGGLFEGRAHEFSGLGLIAFGALLVLSVYLKLAGPLGRALDSFSSFTIGVGRYFLPILCIGLGVALARRKNRQNQVRTAIGWTSLTGVLLGLTHVFFSDVENRTGGWFGYVVGEPTKNSLSDIGATVLLIALLIGSVMLVSGKSAPELIVTIRNAWRKISGKVSLATENLSGALDENRGYGGEQSDMPGGFAPQDDQRPELYDYAQDGLDDDYQDQEKQPRRERKRREQAQAKTAAKPAAKLAPVKGEPQEMSLGPSGQPSDWMLPELEFLSLTSNKKANEEAIRERGDQLVAALASHGVDTELVGYTRGPTVTRYELSLGDGVKVAKVTTLSRDIAYTMAATDVRILAPIPGRSAIGIEVPNEQRELVSIGDLLVSQEARTATHPLDVAVGKDISGRPVFLNISTTPHLLIAGATGAGKSSVINCIITSVLMRATPDQVKLILIDPKQVEMAQYTRLPHLLTAPVTNPKKAANALGWAVKEMERRYDLLVEAGFRDVAGYNAAYDRGEMTTQEGQPSDKQFSRIPYILIVVDELNDLMMVAARDVEDCITRIAQKARAVGIHLVVATQRPSVNVITGVIKANIPARMAFAVSSLTDSRVILDQPGAEKLVGMGDMLMLPGNTSVSQRLQSAWVSENEVRKVVGHWRRQAPEVTYVSGIEGDANKSSSNGGIFGGSSGDEDDDELMRQAMDLVVRTQQGSTSMLQRKLKVGFARAGRLMDMLEQRGVVAPSEGSRPREVLMTVEELEIIQKAS
ncbi:MAG: DNA translocase FtsK 4TM domain-containing protein [Actinomycetota bacterium]|nr:DNA translocase FtsK 4TM domain-containing protein [Actinomycetota bacterium]